jgi:hypothetical protein
MASDSKRFHRALEKWRDHHIAGEFSESPKLGKTAIAFSLIGSVSNEEHADIQKQIDYYEEEARFLGKRISEMGGKAILFAGFTLPNLQSMLEDRSIANIYLVGDGAFSYIYNDESYSDEGADGFIDWTDISDMTTHLKRGIFVQRTCAMFTRNLSVPFGAFAMASHANVFSPLGNNFSPEIYTSLPFLESPEEDKIVQVYQSNELTYNYVRAAYNSEQVIKASPAATRAV